MDMGTGKTITMLELIKRKSKKIDKVLWFTPVSAMENLRRNILENSNFLEHDFIKFYGIESISQSDRIYLEVLRIFEKEERIMLIVDESTLIKNFFAKRSERLRYISELCKYRYIMNGTPVTRDIVDIFSQFYILDKRILGYSSFYSFANNHFVYDDFGKRTSVLDQEYLMQRITPYTFKIKKSECIDLPKRNINTYYFNLTEEQSIHYEQIKQELLMSVDDFDSTTIYKLFTALQLITSARKVSIDNIHKSISSENFFNDKKDNPRLKALSNIIKSEDEKTLIWCKYRHEVDDITSYLIEEYGEEYVCRFDGAVSIKERNIMIDKFKNKARFLVANKSCGGFGLNLQFCNRAIYYNNDFNWGTRQQSLDRVYRLGQNKKVFITDICASYKVDERILENLKKKKNLDETFNERLRKYNKVDIDKWIDNRLKAGRGWNDKNRFRQATEATRDTEAY
ncbi:helicase-related protein [Peptostreptococcus sp. D1]|uniref:helicase-related protein n=1 Tax=Peptostreptococcus sp. D1 TaxID=72304 RepID=UPI0015A6B11B|nr:DEAD/DEAH box helicase [Peptostreptococcus sp. D1]